MRCSTQSTGRVAACCGAICSTQSGARGARLAWGFGAAAGGSGFGGAAGAAGPRPRPPPPPPTPTHPHTHHHPLRAQACSEASGWLTPEAWAAIQERAAARFSSLLGCPGGGADAGTGGGAGEAAGPEGGGILPERIVASLHQCLDQMPGGDCSLAAPVPGPGARRRPARAASAFSFSAAYLLLARHRLAPCRPPPATTERRPPQVPSAHAMLLRRC